MYHAKYTNNLYPMASSMTLNRHEDYVIIAKLKSGPNGKLGSRRFDNQVYQAQVREDVLNREASHAIQQAFSKFPWFA